MWETVLLKAIEAKTADGTVTVQDIAQKAGINAPSLYRFTNGLTLSVPLFEKLADALGYKLVRK